MKFDHFTVLSIEVVTSRVIEICSHLVVNDSKKPATSLFGKERCHNLNCRCTKLRYLSEEPGILGCRWPQACRRV